MRKYVSRHITNCEFKISAIKIHQYFEGWSSNDWLFCKGRVKKHRKRNSRCRSNAACFGTFVDMWFRCSRVEYIYDPEDKIVLLRKEGWGKLRSVYTLSKCFWLRMKSRNSVVMVKDGKWDVPDFWFASVFILLKLSCRRGAEEKVLPFLHGHGGKPPQISLKKSWVAFVWCGPPLTKGIKLFVRKFWKVVLWILESGT